MKEITVTLSLDELETLLGALEFTDDSGWATDEENALAERLEKLYHKVSA